MNDRKEIDQQAHKRAYKTPKLKEFGSVKELTQGGSGNANEGSQGGGAKPRP